MSDQNNNNHNDNVLQRQQQQIPKQQLYQQRNRLNAVVSSSHDSLSSYSQTHSETETTHSYDHLTGGISRTSTPSQETDTSTLMTRQVQFPEAQNYIYNNNNNNPSQQQFLSQETPPHIEIYMLPTEPPPSQPPSTSLPMNRNNNDDWPPPPNYQSEPPQYTPPSTNEISSKNNNSDATLEAGNSNYNDDELKPKLQTDRSIRMAFVRKVYFILTMQLLLTISLSVIFMYYEPMKEFVKDHQWLFFVSWILTFTTLIILFWQRKRSPLNFILLALFTIFMSYGVGTIVSMYSSKVVLQSFLITFGVFLALEVFTFQSKYDFSSWGPFLYASLWIVIFASVIGWLFPYDKGYHMAISIVSALLFSAYIIYDTYMIFNRVSPEEYILAAVDLYLDVLNLFVAIIAIIGGTGDR